MNRRPPFRLLDLTGVRYINCFTCITTNCVPKKSISGTLSLKTLF